MYTDSELPYAVAAIETMELVGKYNCPILVARRELRVGAKKGSLRALSRLNPSQMPLHRMVKRNGWHRGRVRCIQEVVVRMHRLPGLGISNSTVEFAK